MRTQLVKAVIDLHATDALRAYWDIFATDHLGEQLEIERDDEANSGDVVVFDDDADAASYVAERLMDVHGGNVWAHDGSCNGCRLCLVRELLPSYSPEA